MIRVLSSLAVVAFLFGGLIALPAGCEKNTDEVKYTRTVDGNGDVKVEKKVERNDNGYKSEKKIETDHGDYKTKQEFKADENSAKFERKVETPSGEYKVERKVDKEGNVDVKVHHDD